MPLPTITPADPRLTEVNHKIDQARDKAKQLWVEFDQAREKALALEKWSADAPEAREAHEIHKRYEQAANELEGLCEQREVLWGGSPADHGRSPGAVDMTKAGGWLAQVVRHAVTTSDIGSMTDIGQPFFDRLYKASALLSSGVSTLDIQTTSVKVSRLTGRMAAAVPIPELDPIPEEDPPIGQEEVTPPKYAKLVTVSYEALRDARPAALAATETEMVRSIATGFDRAGLHGAAAPQLGLENTAGVAVLNPQPLTNLDWLVYAKGALDRVEGQATAVYLSPEDGETLGLIKKATDSNEPLVTGDNVAADAAPPRLLGVPAYVSTGVNAGTAFVAQANELVVVRRQDVEVAVDEHFKFAEAGAGIRTIARLYLHVAQPEAVVVVPFAPVVP